MSIVSAAVAKADLFDGEPISYSTATPANRVSRLQAELDSGKRTLEYTKGLGYLPALLEAIEVPAESQMLVFSKTSLQISRIKPATPRAIYFSDDVYVGFCQTGDVLEVSAVDPQLGTVFYTIDQDKETKPRAVRQTDSCLICHSSSRTGSVPGHVVRSLFVDASGHGIFSAGGYSVDHRTPFENRWGGWYVTGTHGTQTHLGNYINRGREVRRPVNNAKGQNVTDLKDFLAVDKYLTPHSDIVALMVLEHQTLVHNRLTSASFTTRQALHYEQGLNKALGNPLDKRLDSTTRRIQDAGNDLVEALLFVDESPLNGRIVGTSGYAEKFSQRGARDPQGRSLRDFDLQRRMFKHPCSYLIYSEAFDALPAEMKKYVWNRLWQVLGEGADEKEFAHLSADDRQAIVEILRATKPDLPEFWQASD